jgi:hypothetical protein
VADHSPRAAGSPLNPAYCRVLARWKLDRFRAAADAQKIVDMVLGLHPEFVATADPEPDRPHPLPPPSQKRDRRRERIFHVSNGRVMLGNQVACSEMQFVAGEPTTNAMGVWP